jgi:iron(III) transport system ATP-binding protein
MFLDLDRISVRYDGRAGSRAAVDAVLLRLTAGQIGVLIGPSGCGKTTLLRAIAGLERAVAGRVSVTGEVLSDARSGVHVAPELRRIGMVFQDYALFPHLSVADNIAFGLRHLSVAERRVRVQEVPDLARALAPRPRLLLLDEPFSNLDVGLRERLAQEVRVILKQAGPTALFVTHDQLEAFAVGDLIGVLHQGRLEQWDDAYSLYHRPATRFVADFIGHGVFTPARIVAGPDGRSATVHTPLGDLNDMAEFRCPMPIPAACAMCCCAPTTSSTMTPPRCRRASSARRSAAPTSFTHCVWPAVNACWRTCRRTTTTTSANGSAFVPPSITS